MKISKRLRYFAASFLMLFSTVTPLGGSLVPSVYAAGNPPATVPTNKKTIKNNGDGTYTIALSVTGETSTNSTSEVSKANVILVMDTSSSMNNDAASTNHTYYAVPGTPDAPSSDGVAATYYRNDNGTYRQLYYRNNAWRTSNSNNGTVFTGQFYARSRLWAVKHTMTDTDGVIDSLLSQNVAGDAIKKILLKSQL